MRSALVLFLLCLTSWSFPTAASAQEFGEPRDPAKMKHGGLLLRDPTQGDYREAPAVETEVAIEVSGLIARTRVTQRFENPTDNWLEGVYVFPLPENSAVDELHMKIGDRVIEGQIKERAKAKAAYEEAKRAGKKASLVEQERPNLFTTSVANLGPAERIEITITYQETARYDKGRFSLRFPMAITPRYNPGTSTVTGFEGTGWGTNTDSVPDAARMTPPVSDPADAPARPVTIRAEIDAGFPLSEVVSPSHAVRVRALDDHVYSVRLREEAVPANADFVLDWAPVVGEAPGAALFRERWEGEEYALVMVLPPTEPQSASQRFSREMLIVIDTSGSMSGESIVQAKRAVQNALDQLRPEDSFNVIRFSSTTQTLFPEARPAAARTLELARAWVDRLEAEGGTEMQPALEAALKESGEARAVRQVIFVTDGAVGNERALFQILQEKLGRSRLFTVGIGSAPNSFFMTKAAEVGRGAFTYIAHPAEVAEKMGALFEKIASPVFHDLALDWDVDGVEAWPKRLPDVYAGEPVLIAARLPKRETRVTLRGRRGTEALTLPLPVRGGSDHPGVARLWARRKIASLMDGLHNGVALEKVSAEVGALGVRHHLVTRWSSLVAVDVTPTAPVGTRPDTRAIPTLLPKGAERDKIFGPGKGMAPALASDVTLVSQPATGVQVGVLPRGGSPAALLMLLGGTLLGTARFAWPGKNSAVGRQEERETP